MSENKTIGNVPITVARGDGIGPEIMDATLHVLQEAGAALDIEQIQVGEKIYLQGNTTGMGEEAWESLKRTRVFLKAPITTPQGGGVKSLNVTTRKTLGLFANVRPCVTYFPFIQTKHPGMDVVIVRENEEDLYAGIEYRQTQDVTECVKLISRPGSEKIIRYAFEYAVANGRKKVTCFTKDNIMKLTDGLFHEVFTEIAKEYPNIENEHWIVDIGCAKLADSPINFDVVVLPNLYGDILSDMSAQIAGSVGIAGSANIGANYAMFEAIHGSAPRRAGKDMANPTGLLLGSVMMLVHIGQPEVAARVHNAWLATIEDGVHTYDVFDEKTSSKKVGTADFAKEVAQRLGKKPSTLTPASYHATNRARLTELSTHKKEKKELVGVDVFVDDATSSAEALANSLRPLAGTNLSLDVISNRGSKVWPEGNPETFCSDHWRCRFMGKSSDSNAGSSAGAYATRKDVISLLERIDAAGVDFIKTDLLFNFDGERGYSLSQGE